MERTERGPEAGSISVNVEPQRVFRVLQEEGGKAYLAVEHDLDARLRIGGEFLEALEETDLVRGLLARIEALEGGKEER